MNELALFAGVGGGILGGQLLGWRTVCAVEVDPFARGILLRRQRDGALPVFPVWDDVRTFDGLPWRGRVAVVSGGFPCQDISAAGKGAGIDGARSGLWREMARVVRDVRPRWVFVENSPMLTVRGLGRVLGDLAAMGFNARWGVLGARHAGAPHRRDRIWIRAEHGDANRNGEPAGARYAREAPRVSGVAADADSNEHKSNAQKIRRQGPEGLRPDWWTTEPRLGRVADGVADRVDRLRAIGNGQVPAVAALAWEALT